MRIIIANSIKGTPHDSGAERVATNFGQELKALGHQVFYLYADPGLSDQPTIQNDSVKVPNLAPYWPFENIPRSTLHKLIYHLVDSYNIRYRRIYEDIIEKLAPDIIFTHGLRVLSPYLWRIASTARIPVVHYIHDYYLLCASSNLKRSTKTPYICDTQCNKCKHITLLRRHLSGSVAAVIGASDYVLQKHLNANYFRNATSFVIPPPIVQQLSAKRLYRDGHQIVTFGYIGRLVPDKGILNLLEAFKTLNIPHARLLVAGRPEQGFFELLEPYFKLPSITYLGHVNPESFYSLIDYVVVPSLWPDPNPTVIIEAYQFGKPVIASSMGGIPESVIEGETGTLYDIRDTNEGLMSALYRIAHSSPNFSREKMSAIADQRDPRRATSMLLEIFETVRSCDR